MSVADRRAARQDRRRHQTIALAFRHRAKTATGSERRQWQALLADDDALEAAILAVDASAPEDEDDGGDGPIIKLFKWVLGNLDTILPIILKIIGMFGGAVLAVQTSPPAFNAECSQFASLDGPAKAAAYFNALPAHAQESLQQLAGALQVDWTTLLTCIAGQVGWIKLALCLKADPKNFIRCLTSNVNMPGLLGCLGLSAGGGATDPNFT